MSPEMIIFIRKAISFRFEFLNPEKKQFAALQIPAASII